MAVFNGDRYLHEQLRSILLQLAGDDEVIIVDDVSHDTSVNVIQDIGDPRVTLLKNDVNMGPSLSFERAITKAKGQYIFLSDQDDVWRPHKVSEMRRIFESTASLAVVSDAQIVNAERVTIMGSFYAVRQSRAGFWRNLYRNGFVGCCMAIRADAKAFLIPFPVKVGMHDEWIGLCCSVAGRVTFCKQILIDYRRHSGNVSTLGHGSTLSMVEKRLKLLAFIFKRLPRILKWRFTRRA
jgi:glycosyltransferase involved in cell wall biosynthesis